MTLIQHRTSYMVVLVICCCYGSSPCLSCFMSIILSESLPDKNRYGLSIDLTERYRRGNEGRQPGFTQASLRRRKADLLAG